MAYLSNKSGSRLESIGKFASNDRGNFTMAFAMIMPLVVATVGIAADFGRASFIRTEMKLAADQAAMAATVAVGNGSTTNAAIQLATAQWYANTAGITGATIKPTFSVASSGGKASASVAFSGSVATTFARIMGVQSLSVSGVTGTQGNVTTVPPIRYSGTGTMWGDPHLDGADGYHARFTCPNPYWYNMLSDGGIEANVYCYHMTTGPYPDTDIISDMAVTLGSHTISIHQDAPNPNFTWPASREWLGQVTIDGQVYNPTSTSLLANWPEGTVTAVIGDGGDPANQSLDNITITTPQYNVVLSFEHNNGGNVQITASNAGTCGAPGGLWGETLAGINDTTVSATQADAVDAGQFALPLPTSTSSEFNRKPCPVEVASGLKFTQ